MNSKKNKNIHFKLVGIKTSQFAIIEDNFKKEEDTGLNVKVNYGADPDNYGVAVVFNVRFDCDGKSFLILEVEHHYSIKQEDWNSLLSEDEKTLHLNLDLARHLTVLTVGTTRGVLHSKVENTSYYQLILPTIDLTQFIKEPIDISLKA
ncbi:MAG: hypothetical protein RI562_11745 [Salibacter sp.]|uniref:hypothetical protein n=1 Tax=Salibacter sp. TaxID=2010995 RepID=UPI0028709640|nr:hypothetical protein [Salibacter sp.]MDR9399726.1 hypothetical protein [Salibacter sp.]